MLTTHFGKRTSKHRSHPRLFERVDAKSVSRSRKAAADSALDSDDCSISTGMNLIGIEPRCRSDQVQFRSGLSERPPGPRYRLVAAKVAAADRSSVVFLR
jgi:hypothetical protein